MNNDKYFKQRSKERDKLKKEYDKAREENDTEGILLVGAKLIKHHVETLSTLLAEDKPEDVKATPKKFVVIPKGHRMH